MTSQTRGRLVQSRTMGVSIFCLVWRLCLVWEPSPALLRRRPIRRPRRLKPAALYDTGSVSADPLDGEVLTQRTGWVNQGKAGSMKGDAVLTTAGLAVVARSEGPSLEVYGGDGNAWKLRATLVPSGVGDWKIAGLKALQSDATAAGMEVTFSGKAGKAILDLGVEAGKPILKTKPVSGVEGLKMSCESRLGVLPISLPDDMVIDARAIPIDKAEIPAENFFMNMLDNGNSIVTAIWDKNARDVELILSGEKDATGHYGRECVLRRGGRDLDCGAGAPRDMGAGGHYWK